jgi:hypothetical protein
MTRPEPVVGMAGHPSTGRVVNAALTASDLLAAIRKAMLDELTGVIPDWAKWLIGLSSMACAGYLISSLVRAVGRAEGVTEEVRDMVVGEPLPDLPKKRFAWAPVLPGYKKMNPSADARRKFMDIASGNFVRVDLRGSTHSGDTGGLFLTGNMLVLCAHALENLRPGDVITVDGYSTQYGDHMCWKDPRSDLAFLRLDIPPRPDLRKYLVSDEKGVSPGIYTLLLLRRGDIKEKHSGFVQCARTVPFAPARLEDVLLVSTSCETRSGDCGSPYISADNSETALLFGVHIGTFEGKRCMVPLRRAVVELAVSKLLPTYSLPSNEVGVLQGLSEVHPKSIVQWDEDLSAAAIGSRKGHVPKQKSHLVATRIAPLLGERVPKEPPDFRTQVVGERHVNSFVRKAKAQLAAQPGDEVLFWEAWKSYKFSLGIHSFEGLRPLTTSETIAGTPGQMWSNPINKKTSAGLLPGKKGDYLVDDGVNEELGERIKQILKQYALRERSGTAYTWNLKDEPIKREKVLAGKIRVFASPDLPYFFLDKMVWAPIINVFRKHSQESEHCVGVNVYSQDWAAIAHYYASSGFPDDTFTDADVAEFDNHVYLPLVLRGLIMHLRDVAPEYLSRRVTVGEVSLSVEDVMWGLLSDESYHWVVIQLTVLSMGNETSSGKFATAELNSIYQSVLHRKLAILSWLDYKGWQYTPLTVKLAARSLELTYGEDWFRANVRLKNYGDDNVDQISSAWAKWFTGERRQRVAALVGVGLTDAQKTGKISFRRLGDVVFLKRKFRVEGKRVFAPLDLESIWNMLQWRDTSSTLSVNEMEAQLLAQAIRELFQHGREVYARERKRLLAIADALSIGEAVRALSPGYDELLIKFDNGSLVDFDIEVEQQPGEVYEALTRLPLVEIGEPLTRGGPNGIGICESRIGPYPCAG